MIADQNRPEPPRSAQPAILDRLPELCRYRLGFAGANSGGKFRWQIQGCGVARQVKLPVASVFGDAFAFSVRNFPTVLRLCLAALVVLALPISGLLYLVVPQLLSSAPPLTSDLTPEAILELVSGRSGLWLGLTLLIFMASGLLFTGMVLAPLTRLIVLEERPPVFSFNRLLGTFLTAWAVFTALILVLIFSVFSTLVFPYTSFLDADTHA